LVAYFGDGGGFFEEGRRRGECGEGGVYDGVWLVYLLIVMLRRRRRKRRRRD
jgi:hypothetical protein